jgi:hypothetical protein
MKRVINGKTYNTYTATRIASWSNGLCVSDFSNSVERLYKTNKGAFFLAGQGGAFSRWGDNSNAGEGIDAMSEAEALNWCEEHNVDADVIEEHFNIEEA